MYSLFASLNHALSVPREPPVLVPDQSSYSGTVLHCVGLIWLGTDSLGILHSVPVRFGRPASSRKASSSKNVIGLPPWPVGFSFRLPYALCPCIDLTTRDVLGRVTPPRLALS